MFLAARSWKDETSHYCGRCASRLLSSFPRASGLRISEAPRCHPSGRDDVKDRGVPFVLIREIEALRLLVRVDVGVERSSGRVWLSVALASGGDSGKELRVVDDVDRNNCVLTVKTGHHPSGRASAGQGFSRCSEGA
jgi:hypothetical protein